MTLSDFLTECLESMSAVPLVAEDRAVPSINTVSVFAEQTIVDSNHASACVAAAYLAYQALEQSHAISQKLAIPAGKYWHGIMHRLEGDFDNSRYWMKLAALEEPFDLLQHQIQARIPEPAIKPIEMLLTRDVWDPVSFISLIQQSGTYRDEARTQLRRIQVLEWHALTAYCYGQALGQPLQERQTVASLI